MQIGQMQTAQLGHSKPGGVESLDNETVPAVGAPVHQIADLLRAQRHRGPLGATSTHHPAVHARAASALTAVPAARHEAHLGPEAQPVSYRRFTPAPRRREANELDHRRQDPLHRRR